MLSHVDRDNHLVASRVARATYGVVYALPVKETDEEHLRRKQQWERDPTGDCYVPGYFESKLHRVRFVRRVACDILTESTPIARVLQSAREWNSGIHFRSRKEVQQTLACRPYASCAIEVVYPTRNGWIRIDASSFHFLPRVLALTWIIVASFSTLCTIRADLSVAVKDLVLKEKASGQVYYQLDYAVIILFGLTELQAFLAWNSRVSRDAIQPPAFLIKLSFQEGAERR